MPLFQSICLKSYHIVYRSNLSTKSLRLLKSCFFRKLSQQHHFKPPQPSTISVAGPTTRYFRSCYHQWDIYICYAIPYHRTVSMSEDVTGVSSDADSRIFRMLVHILDRGPTLNEK